MQGLTRVIRRTAAGLFLSAGAFGASVWVEGEAAAEKGNSPHPWWYDKVKAEVLSDGAWLSHFNAEKEGTAGYRVMIPEGGDYVLWVRANPVQARLSVKVDTGEWLPVDLSEGNLRGDLNIAADNKPDLRFIAWAKAGAFALGPGEHVLEFRFHSEAQNHGAIDCFVFTNDGFVPSGATKPGATAKSMPAPPEDAIWIEGEKPSRGTMNRHPWWYDQVKKDVLSGGDWISNFSDDKDGTAEYDFEVAEADTFAFWIRANPLRSRVAYRLDGGEWAPIDLNRDKRGEMNIAADNKPDLRFIAWSKVGDLALSAGTHTIAFRIDSELSHHGAIDCFTFVRIPFVPSGARKPSVAAAEGAPDEWFAVLPDDDPLSPESVTDMSRLVEAPAGTRGFLRTDGGDLRFEEAAAPVKFWAINSNLAGRTTATDMEQAARWYRKHGINLVRQHTVIGDVGLLRPDGTFDPARMDRYDRWFAILKAQGIYTTWSVIYPHHGAMLRATDGADPERFAQLDAADEARDGSKGPIVVNDYINLDRTLQDIALRYFRALLEHVNPHTGLAYKDDPALAVVEFQNESNLFFHTLNGLRSNNPPAYAAMMRRGFFEFVKQKYGSRDAVAAAWDGKWDRDDKWEQGELGIMAPFHWGTDGPQYEFAGQLRRCGDTIEFMADLQRSYYARRQKELRDIGFRGVTVTTAWQAVGGSSLANLWCDNEADMIDRHNYFGGGDGGHVITEGKVSNATHLSQPGHGLLNVGLFQVDGKPFGVSEWTMMPPAPFKAEAAPLYAFYGIGLQGWDASYHFACSEKRLGDGWPGLGKYASHTPHYFGQFPALAFAVHNGHVAEGQPVAIPRVGPDELFAGKDVLRQSIAHGTHDEKALGEGTVTAPELLAVGRVGVAFGDPAAATVDPAPFIDREAKVLHSTTGQLAWHYGDRYVEVRTPKTQGVIGFAGGKTVELPGVAVTVKTPFVSLILTPLDNQDLRESKHILVTAMARDKQTGSEFNADWSELKTVGGPPLLAEPVQATIALAGSGTPAVHALDIYGVRKGTTVSVKADGSFSIDGRYRTFYYEIVR